MLTQPENAESPTEAIREKSMFRSFTPGHQLNAELSTVHPTARLISRFVIEEMQRERLPTLEISPAKDTLPGLGFLFP